MDFIDEEYGARLLLEFVEEHLEALLEVSTVLRAGQQGAQVEQVHDAVSDHLRHIGIHDALRQTLGDGGLAHARLADQERIVLAAATEDLDDALQFVFPTHQGIDGTCAGKIVQVAGESLQRALRLALASTLNTAMVLGTLPFIAFGYAMRDVIDHVDALDVLLLQQVDGRRLLLVENGHERIGAGHFLAAAGLNMEYRAAQNALEAQGHLRVPLSVAGGNERRRLFDMLAEGGAQAIKVGTHLDQHVVRGCVVEKCQEQMLHGQKLVAFRLRVLKRLGDGRVHVLAKHG